MYAQVIIDIAHAKVDHVFSYQVPEDMEIAPGDRVLVPFGKGNTPKEGYIIDISEETAYRAGKIKTILKKEDTFSAFLPEQIELAKWMAVSYHCFMVDALRLMIPAQLRGPRVKELAARGKRRKKGPGTGGNTSTDQPSGKDCCPRAVRILSRSTLCSGTA